MSRFQKERLHLTGPRGEVLGSTYSLGDFNGYSVFAYGLGQGNGYRVEGHGLRTFYAPTLVDAERQLSDMRIGPKPHKPLLPNNPALLAALPIVSGMVGKVAESARLPAEAYGPPRRGKARRTNPASSRAELEDQARRGTYEEFHVGDAVVLIRPGRSGDWEGTVYAPINYGTEFEDWFAWDFDGLRDPPAGSRGLESTVSAAISFGSYYSSGNRGFDTPEWAPDEETADTIRDATEGVMTEDGEYLVVWVGTTGPRTNPLGKPQQKGPQTAEERRGPHCHRGNHAYCAGFIAIHGRGKWPCECPCHKPKRRNPHLMLVTGNPPDHECAWCIAELGRKPSPNASHGICRRHYVELVGEEPPAEVGPGPMDLVLTTSPNPPWGELERAWKTFHQRDAFDGTVRDVGKIPGAPDYAFALGRLASIDFGSGDCELSGGGVWVCCTPDDHALWIVSERQGMDFSKLSGKHVHALTYDPAKSSGKEPALYRHDFHRPLPTVAPIGRAKGCRAVLLDGGAYKVTDWIRN